MIITPAEIKEKVSKWFYPFLSASVDGDFFFPKEVRFAKVKSSWARDRFNELHVGLRNLRQGSKEVQGAGYTVVWQEVANRSVGKNEFPGRITIDSKEDFLCLLDEDYRRMFVQFESEISIIRTFSSELLQWVRSNPQKVCNHAGEWSSLLMVCDHFMHTHSRNQYYIRELPIEVHTKFIEQHKGILNELLTLLLPDFLIDDSYTGTKEHHFERRYGLKYDETLVRYRSLEAQATGVSDFSIRYTDFAKHEIPSRRVIITENKMNFLTLPNLENTLSIWGGGFNLHILKHATWLKNRHIYYWGDIDAHGFWMLAQFREYYPTVTSLMMDWETFRRFEYGAEGKPINQVNVNNLTDEEYSLYDHVKENNYRLEQEKIPYDWAVKHVRQLIG